MTLAHGRPTFVPMPLDVPCNGFCRDGEHADLVYGALPLVADPELARWLASLWAPKDVEVLRVEPAPEAPPQESHPLAANYAAAMKPGGTFPYPRIVFWRWRE